MAHSTHTNNRSGFIVPHIETVANVDDPVAYFAKLSDYGRKPHSILLESADIVPKYGENSLGSADPCLRVFGKGKAFEVRALNALGERFLEILQGRFEFCKDVHYGKKEITGTLVPARGAVSEEERLKLPTHMDILRSVAYAFTPTARPFVPYGGLFGAFSYDFIDQFEDLPANKEDILNEPDYIFYYLDNLFLCDHKAGKMHIIANALQTDGDHDGERERCERVIEQYKDALSRDIPKARRFPTIGKDVTSDVGKDEFINIVRRLKEHILCGDVFQIVASRTTIAPYSSEPLDIYTSLRKLNPSPYMFYINDGEGILLGASPEMSLRVQGIKEKTVEIRPIAGTKPRGIVNGKIDPDLDSRYETELKIDAKELAEHTMLIDLARNDVARISRPGTRVVDEPFIVEKYSHVQHLVSNVKGTLKPGLDALHAYLASMNMGTLTGAPKVEAMKLLRKFERTKRGFYGGAVGYLTPHKDFDSTIIIRSMRLKEGKAYVRAGAGIVLDSIPEKEFEETEKKAAACLAAIRQAGGRR